MLNFKINFIIVATSVEEILYIILNDVSSLPRSDVTGFASPFIESIREQKEMVFESFSKDDDGDLFLIFICGKMISIMGLI